MNLSARFGESQRDGAGRVAGQVNDVEAQVANGHLVAVFEEHVRGDGKDLCVEGCAAVGTLVAA